VAAAHQQALEEMQALQRFAPASSSSRDGVPETLGEKDGERVLLGYFEQGPEAGPDAGSDGDEGRLLRAIAGAQVVIDEYDVGMTLLVKSLVVHPSELNDMASTAALRLKVGLYCLADQSGVTLDMTPVQLDGREPICMTYRRAEDS